MKTGGKCNRGRGIGFGVWSDGEGGRGWEERDLTGMVVRIRDTTDVYTSLDRTCGGKGRSCWHRWRALPDAATESFPSSKAAPFLRFTSCLLFSVPPSIRWLLYQTVLSILTCFIEYVLGSREMLYWSVEGILEQNITAVLRQLSSSFMHSFLFYPTC